MTDVFTPEKRRRIMARVKGADTRPEILVRSLVHRMGFRFRLHRRELPGCPDLVLRKHGKVIFVHGCFWHGHQGCRRSGRPSSNMEFWNRKLSGNMERDARNQESLRKDGWKVLVVWECETKDREKLKAILRDFLVEPRP
ncbi:MAG: very short patch repair endonuclease [Pseudomonadota bacterium]